MPSRRLERPSSSRRVSQYMQPFLLTCKQNVRRWPIMALTSSLVKPRTAKCVESACHKAIPSIKAKPISVQTNGWSLRLICLTTKIDYAFEQRMYSSPPPWLNRVSSPSAYKRTGRADSAKGESAAAAKKLRRVTVCMFPPWKRGADDALGPASCLKLCSHLFNLYVVQRDEEAFGCSWLVMQRD